MSFKVGEAPWEVTEKQASGFKVGEAPWEKTDTKGDEVAAALEGAGNSLTLGWQNNLRAATEPATFWALNKLTGNDVEADDYVAARDKYEEETNRLKKENPKAFLGGEIAGGLVSGIATSPLTVAKGATALARTAHAARMGAGIGLATNAGNTKGETGIDVGQTLKNGAFGAGIGAGGQLIGEGIGSLLSKKGAKVPADTSELNADQAQSAMASAEGSAKSSAIAGGGETTVENSGQLFDIKKPQTLDELRNWQPPEGAGAVPGAQRLKQIEEVVPDLQTKPLNYHHEMLRDPKAMKAMKLEFENLPTDDARKIAIYNQTMLDEAGNKTLETVNNIAGRTPLNKSEAGTNLIESVKDIYKKEKEALGPVFEELKNAPPMGREETLGLAQNIAENTKAGKLLDVDETGKLFLKGNTPRTGMSDSEHSILSRVINDLNDGMTFKELQDTRDFLRKAIDPSNPAATEELSKVRSLMLDQLEQMSSKNPNVRDTFKAYAKNERTRENIEKIIGGKIESLDAMFAANPDKVVQKVFSNPNYKNIVEGYVGAEKMTEMLQSYVGEGVQKAFDSTGAFNPSTLKNWLKQNNGFLTANMPEETLARLNALADHGYYAKRFLDEVNPSGTAASLIAALEPKSFIQKVIQKGPIAAVTSEAAERVNTFTNQKQSLKYLNQVLGDAPPEKVASFVENIRQRNPKLAEFVEMNLQNTVTRGASPYYLKQATPMIRTGERQDNQENVSEAKQNEMVARIKKNPAMINSIQDPRLKELLKNKVRESSIKDKVPIEAAQAAFVDNN